jgi:hypothetical protein
VREAARELGGPSPAGVAAEPTDPYATAVVFPTTGLGGALTIADVEELYARDGVVTLFLPAS